MNAIEADNLAVFRLLVDGGASLSTIDDGRYNILHFAACHADVETIDYLAGRELADIDPSLCGLDEKTMLRALAWCLLADESAIRYFDTRRPSVAERRAFIALYLKTLSCRLESRCSSLRQPLQAAAQRDAVSSFQQTGSLIKKSRSGHRQDLVDWYRGIESYFRAGSWDLVIGIVLDEVIETLKDLGRVCHGRPLQDPTVREPVESELVGWSNCSWEKAREDSSILGLRRCTDDMVVDPRSLTRIFLL